MRLPGYTNTHTESSGTGLQTSRLREDARQIIRHAVGATADDPVRWPAAADRQLLGGLYFISPATADYIAAAVELIAADGYRLLPDYASTSTLGSGTTTTGHPAPRSPCTRSSTVTTARSATPATTAEPARKPSPTT